MPSRFSSAFELRGSESDRSSASVRAMFGSQLLTGGIAGVAGCGAGAGVVVAAVVVVVAAGGGGFGTAPAAAVVVAAAGVGLPASAPAADGAGLPAVAPAAVVVGAEAGASFEYSTKANVNGCSGPSFVILTLATIVVAASLAGRWSPFKVASSVRPSGDRRIGNVAMSFGAL